MSNKNDTVKTQISITLKGTGDVNNHPDAEATTIIMENILKIMKIVKNEVLHDSKNIKILLTDAMHSSPACLSFAYDMKDTDQMIMTMTSIINAIIKNPNIIKTDKLAKKVIKPIKCITEQQKNKLGGCTITNHINNNSIVITQEDCEKINNLDKIFHYEYDSFCGILEVVNLHKKQKFNIYTATQHSIPCVAEDKFRASIIEFTGKNVYVEGKAKYTMGDLIPKELSIKKIELIENPTQDISLLKKCITNIDGLPHDYINKIRED